MVVAGPCLEAAEYSSAAEVLAAVEGFAAEVALRMHAIAETQPGARSFVQSVLRDHQAHRVDRERFRRRLGLPVSDPGQPEAANLRDLPALRSAQERLVYAHAEGLPALGDRAGVALLAGHIVDLSRHLTVIDLWIEGEALS